MACRLGVLGTFGRGDLGDDALLVAFLQWIRRNAPHVDPVGIAHDPDAVTAAFGITAIAATHRALQVQSGARRARGQPSTPPPVVLGLGQPPAGGRADRSEAPWRQALHRAARRSVSRLRWWLGAPGAAVARLQFLHLQYDRMRSLRGVVVLGGNQLFDRGEGPFGHAFTLFSWALVARLRGKPIVMMSVGAEAPDRRLTQVWLRTTLRWCGYVSFRDQASLARMRGLGFDGEASVVPDLAFGLSIDRGWSGTTDATAEISLSDLTAPRTVGLSPSAHQHPYMSPAADPDGYRRYIEALAGLCAGLVREGQQVVLFPTELHSDRVAMLDLLARIPSDALHGVRMESVATVPELVLCLGRLDAVVATRYYGVLLALLRSRPALSIADSAQHRALLDAFDLGRFAAAASGAESDVLLARYGELRVHYVEARAALTATLPRLRQRIDAQYRDVFLRCGWEDAATMPLIDPAAAERT